ncbi:MAG: triose-phosphate isomerase [Anaerolineae bacterium]|nr:triose-phosphate isomerase [Anaerolineae bacterium]
MRTPIIAGNWKMYKTVGESVSFVRELLPHLQPYEGVERVVIPTFLALYSVAQVLQGTFLKVGAQQVHYEAEGAFTSQISPRMLQGLAEYVLVGHSECRQYLAETDETVNKKTRSALKHGLKVIVAVGENQEQNRAGQTQTLVGAQVRAALRDVSADDVERVVVAYEPVWAIGTGLNCPADQAQAIIGGTIRGVLRDLYGEATAERVRIQYGGSVKPENMLDYMSQPDIDGALVGGASLKIEPFTQLVALAAQAKGL